jgi:hypothetical protein
MERSLTCFNPSRSIMRSAASHPERLATAISTIKRSAKYARLNARFNGSRTEDSYSRRCSDSSVSLLSEKRSCSSGPSWMMSPGASDAPKRRTTHAFRNSPDFARHGRDDKARPRDPRSVVRLVTQMQTGAVIRLTPSRRSRRRTVLELVLQAGRDAFALRVVAHRRGAETHIVAFEQPGKRWFAG